MDVSVLIPTYNQEKYVKETLLSTIFQKTADISFEVFVADDASTDGTLTIIEEVKKSNPEKLNVIRRPENIGLMRNLFSAIEQCNGDYIAICGGDDIWLPQKLQRQVDRIRLGHDCGAIYSCAYTCDKEGKIQCGKNIGTRGADFSRLLKGNTIPACTVIFRKDLALRYIDEVSLFERNWLMEDYPFWLWISLRSNICFIDEPLAVYRILDNSLSHFTDRKKEKSFSLSRLEIMKFFMEISGTELPRSFKKTLLKQQAELTFLEPTTFSIDKLRADLMSAENSDLGMHAKILLLLSFFPATTNYLFQFSGWAKSRLKQLT